MPTAAEVEPAVKTGPGRFNNPEAFCWIEYAYGTGEKMKSLRIWNSRDGKVPPSFKHPTNNLTYTKVLHTEVSAIDEMPGIGELIFVDENSKGTPKIAIVDLRWQEKHRRLYSNPQAVINRLEGIITATKRQLDEANQTIREKDAEIVSHKDNVRNLESDVMVMKAAYAAKDEQLVICDKEIAALRKFYELSHQFAGDILKLTTEELDKLVMVTVDGYTFDCKEREIDYDKIVNLAGQKGTPSVTYKNGHPPKIEGILAPGNKIRVKNGMVFNVSGTGFA